MLKNLIFTVLITYVAIVLCAYFFSDKMIFPWSRASYGDTEEIIKIITTDHKAISALYLSNPQAKYTILYNHGNYEDLGTIRPRLNNFKQHGFAVFAYDYHGYGTSEGKASEQNAYYDIDAAYDYLIHKLKVKPKQVILYGFSVGAAPAIDLAGRRQVRAIIIQSPFLTAYRTVTQIPILPFDKFDNLAKIKKIHVPILIIHGNKDRIIPFWQGRKLYEVANPPKYFYWLNGAGHNNLLSIAGVKYWQTIKDFADKL